MGNSFLKRNASTILTCVGALGVIATAVLTAKATPKALKAVDKAEEEKGEQLTKIEVVKAAAPAYIPAAVTGVSTIACVFGANILNKHTQASLASAYALLSSTYNKYKDKVEELYGEEADDRVMEEIAHDVYVEREPDILSEDESLFFDFVSQQYFTANMNDVIQKVTMDDGMECYIITTPFDIPWFSEIS